MDQINGSPTKPESQTVPVFLLKVLLLLLVLAVGVFLVNGREGIFRSLAPAPSTTSVTGTVKDGASGKPLQGVTVYTDRELAVTDENGFFRISCGRGKTLTVEARGYKKAHTKIKNADPLMVLLFPEEEASQAPSHASTGMK